MASYCGVFGCTNNSRTMPHLSYFSIPKNEERKRTWAALIGREDLLGKEFRCKHYVCSTHFSNTMFLINRLKPDAVPSLHLPRSTASPQSPPSPSSSSICCLKRNVGTQLDTSIIIQTKQGDDAQVPTHKRKRSAAGGEGGEDDEGGEGASSGPRGHVTCDQESESGQFRVRAVHSGCTYPEARSFTLDQEVLMDLHELSDKIQNFYPTVRGKSFTVTFKGVDGDRCEYVFSSASESRRAGETHGGLSCDECRAEITGFRYKCVSCADYDLCGACEALGVHSQHVVMRISRPLKFNQSRALVQRWCEAMKSAGISSLDELTGEPTPRVRPAATGDAAGPPAPAHSVPDDPDVNYQVISHQPVTVKEEPMDEDEAATPSTSRTIITITKMNPSKVKVPKSRIKVIMSKDKEAATKTKVARTETREEKQIKTEPASGEGKRLMDFYSTFAETEPAVAVQHVKVELEDPLGSEMSQESIEIEDNWSQATSGPSDCRQERARTRPALGALHGAPGCVPAAQSGLAGQRGTVPARGGTNVGPSAPGVAAPGGRLVPASPSQDRPSTTTTYTHKSK